MDEWWTEIDNDILGDLAGHGPMAPAELGRRLGISEGAMASLLSMLVQEGKVRICLVEALVEVAGGGMIERSGDGERGTCGAEVQDAPSDSITWCPIEPGESRQSHI